MSTIQPRPASIRDVRTGGIAPAERNGWQRVSAATRQAPAMPAGPDAPQFRLQSALAAAQAPAASDIAPLTSKSPEQQLATFGKIELLLDRAVAAAGSQRPELELGRNAVAAHVRRMMTLQAGRDGLIGG